MANKEIRQAASMAATDSDKKVIEGKAVSFNERTLLYKTEDGIEFFEEIDSQALSGADLSDCCLKYNHSDQIPILARTRGGSLQTEIKPDGLYFRAEMFNTQAAADCYELVKNGVLQCSFAFTVSEESWDRETHTRKILKIDHIYDLSIVDIPAYKNTFVSEARALFEPKAKEIRTTIAETELRELLKDVSADEERAMPTAEIMDEVRSDCADLRDVWNGLSYIKTKDTRDVFKKLDEARELLAYLEKYKDFEQSPSYPTRKAHSAPMAYRSEADVECFKKYNNRGKYIMNEKEIQIRALQAFISNGIAALTDEQRSAITLDGAQAVLPVTIFEDIISDEKYSDILANAMHINASNAGTLRVPVAATNQAAWHAEGAEVTPETDTLSYIELGGFEVLRITQYSAAVRAMTAAQFETWLTQLLNTELIETLEESFITGTGKGQPLGIENTKNVTAITSESTEAIKAVDIATALGKLPQKYARNAKIYCNAVTAYKLSTEISANDNVLANGKMSVLGKEIVISEFISDGVAYVADPRQLYVRFSQQPTLEVDSSSGFTAALTRMRILAVVDAKWNPKAVVKLSLKTA